VRALRSGRFKVCAIEALEHLDAFDCDDDAAPLPWWSTLA
jgi:hypothetical protein